MHTAVHPCAAPDISTTGPFPICPPPQPTPPQHPQLTSLSSTGTLSGTRLPMGSSAASRSSLSCCSSSSCALTAACRVKGRKQRAAPDQHWERHHVCRPRQRCGRPRDAVFAPQSGATGATHLHLLALLLQFARVLLGLAQRADLLVEPVEVHVEGVQLAAGCKEVGKTTAQRVSGRKHMAPAQRSATWTALAPAFMPASAARLPAAPHPRATSGPSPALCPPGTHPHTACAGSRALPPGCPRALRQEASTRWAGGGNVRRGARGSRWAAAVIDVHFARQPHFRKAEARAPSAAEEANVQARPVWSGPPAR